MKIAFDVMGSDNGSKYPVLAAIKFVQEFDDVAIILVGKREEINSHLKNIPTFNLISSKIQIYDATEVIEMHASAIEGIRKPQSSMNQALQLLKEKKADGVLTAGSTAAYLVLCHLTLKEIPGIKRPAFMPIMPTLIKEKKVLLLDVGANVENTTYELISFAVMAHVYAKLILKIKKPLIGLLNIGAEANKGPKVTRETYSQLNKLTRKGQKLDYLNFYGNIEPRDVLSGKVDIVVCDGYSGNVVLKSVEGMGKVIFSLMKKQFTKNIWRKFLAFLVLPVLKGIKSTFDYKNTGGAQLIGINGICFKAHGSSDVKSFYSTLKLLRAAIKQDVTEKIKSQIEKANIFEDKNE